MVVKLGYNVNSPFIVPSGAAGQRLDVFCVGILKGYSRGDIQRAIKSGAIALNGQQVKPRTVVREGNEITFEKIKTNTIPSSDPQQLPEVPIIYEDRDMVVIQKPAGIAAHAGVGTKEATVAAWYVNKYPQAVDVGENTDRPGIVHRLDKDTSGVMILARTPKAYEHLKQQFKKRRVKKEYLGLVYGVPGASRGRITRPLLRSRRNPLRRTVDEAGKQAITEWKIEQKFERYALIRMWPLTGRMHQLRVHMHFIGHPIVGDKLYVFKRQRPPTGVSRQLLHAEKLTLIMPSKKRKTFAAPLPEDFVTTLAVLKTA